MIIDKLEKLYSKSKRIRKKILFLVDIIVITLSISTISVFRQEPLLYFINDNLIFYMLIGISWFIVFHLTVLGKGETKYLTFKIIVISIMWSFYFLSTLIFYFNTSNDLQMLLILGSIALVNANILTLYRLALRELVRSFGSRNQEKLIILGVGEQEAALANALAFSDKYSVKGFLSVDVEVFGKQIHGLTVYSKRTLHKVKAAGIDAIVVIGDRAELALDDTTVEIIENCRWGTKYVEPLDVVLNKKLTLKDFDAASVLRRSVEVQNQSADLRLLNGKIACVTGAGGSIGSELSRLLLTTELNTLILVDKSEHALYSIMEELSQKVTDSSLNIKLVPILGSLLDDFTLHNIYKYDVDAVYHAAAYKHVPMCEENILAAVKNNVMATYKLVTFSNNHKVEQFTLVSSDKAVRPTNIMGATKRICELIVQSHFTNSITRNSVVRFGNVLSSSGSVIPKFIDQVESGGPVTVTHPDITRYFMTIPEAANLIVIAGSCSNGSEVFLLDMGDQIKIVDLAKSVISSLGYVPVFEKPVYQSEIQIVFSGLRKGEKLFEELLVDSTATPTKHGKIFKSFEPRVEYDVLEQYIKEISSHIENNDAAQLKGFFTTLPIEYSP